MGEVDTAALLEAAFSETFHRKLRQRIVSALLAALPGWREASIRSQARVCALPAFSLDKLPGADRDVRDTGGTAAAA